MWCLQQGDQCAEDESSRFRTGSLEGFDLHVVREVLRADCAA